MTVSFFHRIRVTPTRQSSVLSSRRTSVNTPDNLDETTTAASSAPLPTETPRSRESFEDFTRRLGGLDPMEGPSWLFSDDSPSSNSRQSQSTKPRDEKRQENSLKARLSSASRKISLDEDNNKEIENNEPSRPKKGKSSVDKETKNTEQSENTTSEEISAEISRPRRGAAQAARSSLKEQPINTKLRQGDPASKSVYDDFVPGSKRQSDRKSGKSAKNKRKKSDDPKKEDNNKK